jgi:hypothetical protein
MFMNATYHAVYYLLFPCVGFEVPMHVCYAVGFAFFVGAYARKDVACECEGVEEEGQQPHGW